MLLWWQSQGPETPVGFLGGSRLLLDAISHVTLAAQRMGRGLGHRVSCLLEPHLDTRK